MTKNLITREFKIITEDHGIAEITLADLIKLAEDKEADFNNVTIITETMGYDSPWLEMLYSRQETKEEQARRLANDMNIEIKSQRITVWNIEKEIKDLKKTPVVIAAHEKHKQKIAQKNIQLDAAKGILSRLMEKQQEILQSGFLEEG